jgi:uncharacterized membrane protein/mono/diheme cytochrome c family protein
MPSFRNKIEKDQARDLASHVRAFAPTASKSDRDKQESTSRSAFEKEFRRLQAEREQLKKQVGEKSRESADNKGAKPSTSSPPSPAAKPASKPAAEPAAQAPTDRDLYQQYCRKCHGPDGAGNRVRSRYPEIPNFTDTDWQNENADARFLKSILDGKGKKMPSFQGKINEEQARSLVAYVRAFASTKKTGEGTSQTPSYGRHLPMVEEPEEPAPNQTDEAELSIGFFDKLIRWLGSFHPPTVHFPIALLTAAAVAELLRLLTDKQAFDAVSRYCVWFGTITAFGAGLLGWFLGGFHLADSSGVMTTHRWLGTATVACTGLVLVLSECSCHSDRRRTRTWFRLTLLGVAVLVLATGYFGGALVFGVDHYTWPQ